MTAAMRTLRLPDAERIPRDLYETPAWCSHALIRHPIILDALHEWRPVLIEPCCGRGAIVWAVYRENRFRGLEAADIADELPVGPSILRESFQIRDFLQAENAYREATLCVTNPPFSLAAEFVAASYRRHELTVMLLPLSFLESVKRHSWLSAHPPTLYVLPDRPDFTGRAAPFGCAWFAWHAPHACVIARQVADGRIHHLSLRREVER